jgi:hypothetical protein
VVAGLCKVVPFDLLSNPKLTENTPAQLGCDAFECLQAERRTMFVAKRSRNLTIWDSYMLYISCAKSNPLRTPKQIKDAQDLHNLYSLVTKFSSRKKVASPAPPQDDESYGK